MPKNVMMAPSILSADFTRLADAVGLVADAGADFIHVDVMDGHFVPNLTIGPPVIKSLKNVTDVPLDVHLMIDDADRTVEWYLEAGADLVTVHAEACYHLHRVLQTIRAAGARCGVALNPATPVEVLTEVLGDIDMVLIMSVNPGFGGQAFIPHAATKIQALAEMCEAAGVDPMIQVDGGINAETGRLVVEAGANVLVAGNAVFAQDDPGAAMNAIRRAAQGAA